MSDNGAKSVIHSTVVLNDADDISAYLLDQTGMRPGYLQLSRGPANLKYRTVDLDGVRVLWAVTQADAIWRDQGPESGLHFGFTLACDRSTSVGGFEVDRCDAAVWMPGEEIEVVQLGSSMTLEIGISEALADELGWSLSSPAFRRTPNGTLDALAAVCRRATALATKSDAGRGTMEVCRERVLAALEPALKPWIDDSTAIMRPPTDARACEGIAQKVDRIVSESVDGRMATDELADRLGIPRRSLFYEFRKRLGIGPRRYFELKRLHQLRKRLKEVDPRSSSVTRIATELGFSDLGRMARLYREQFGERPSETLRGTGR